MRKLLLPFATLSVGLAAALPLTAQQPARWFATWAPSPVAAPARPTNPDSVDRVPSYSDRTLRQIVRTSIAQPI